MAAQKSSVKNIVVSEIFGPTLQGEGLLIGQPSVFVRTGGCDYCCKWCDTLYAVAPESQPSWLRMSAREIFECIQQLTDNDPLLITLTGGNPALQPFSSLINIGHKKGYRFALETQGSLARHWFKQLDVLIVSPKTPSSGMKIEPKVVQECIALVGTQTQVGLKFVIADRNDLEWSQRFAQNFPALPITLQPCNPNPAQTPDDHSKADSATMLNRLLWLNKQIQAMHWYDVSILPQLHQLLWGNQRGV